MIFQYPGKNPDLVVSEFRPWTKIKFENYEFQPYGYATYRTILKLPKANMNYSVHFTQLFTASKIWINGELKGQVGNVSSDLTKVIPGRRNTTFKFQSESKYIEIVLQVANSHYYQGGPRGEFLIGSEEKIDNYVIKNIIFDVIVFGLIFGSMIYHLFIYFLNKDNKPFIFYCIVCLTFLLRLPFHNMKLYSIFTSEISWYGQSFFLHFVNIVSILSVVYFLNSLFPKITKPYFFIFYWIGAFAGILIVLIDERSLSYANFFYISFYLPIYLVHAIYLIFFKITEKKSFYLMAIGILGLGFFGLLGIILNLYGIDSGVYIISGFLIFILFQALALSRFYTIALENHSKLKLKLVHENQKNLSEQREELQILMHDSLGGELTDIHVYLEKHIDLQIEELPEKFVPELHTRTMQIIRSFRNHLLFIEDLNITYKNLFEGLNLTILRRYADAGREVEFNIPENLLGSVFQEKINACQYDLPINLFYLFTEICTNDLKYGKNESVWTIGYFDSKISIQQRNQIKTHLSELGLVPKAAYLRVEKMKGELESWISDGIFYLKIEIPLGTGT
ncbi:7TM diverse intracellular signaling domain-containing protein [Leptospira sp. 96542]|nr:7TM diverse intracellular signaling domain-containing protein [Leptospira sp. 96542]